MNFDVILTCSHATVCFFCYIRPMNGETKLYQDNYFTQSRHEFNVIEKRIIYKLITSIRKQFYTDRKDSSTTEITGIILKFKDKEFHEISTSKTLVYKSIKTLKSRVFEYQQDGNWVLVGLINKAVHLEKQGIWEISIDKEIVRNFVLLAANYTAFSLNVAISLRSEYSQRFYEYCAQWKMQGGQKESIKNLRFKLKLDNKYERYSSLKARVIDVAKKELKELFDKEESDLYFDYTEIKDGRSVTHLQIKVIYEENKNRPQISDYDYWVRTALSDVFKLKSSPQYVEYINDVMNVLRRDIKLLKHCHNKITYIQKTLKPSEHLSYLRFVINEEYLAKKDDTLK